MKMNKIDSQFRKNLLTNGGFHIIMGVPKYEKEGALLCVNSSQVSWL